MKKKKQKLSGVSVIFIIFTGILSLFFLAFGIRIVEQFQKGKKLYQSVVSLEGLDPGGDPEEELRKIRGLCSFTPAIEIPVRLRAEGYTMEATWTGVDLGQLESPVSRSWETPLGDTPVLLLGEESLAALTDKNGHMISEEKQREFLERGGELRWQYCLSGETEGEIWKSCLVVGTLSSPSEKVYMPYSQAERFDGIKETKKFLLTVRGKENYEKALEYFKASS